MATTSTTLKAPGRTTIGRSSWIVGGLLAAVLVAAMVVGLQLRGGGSAPAPSVREPQTAILGPITGTGPGLMIVGRDWSTAGSAVSRGAVSGRHHTLASRPFAPVSIRGGSGCDPMVGGGRC
jgi:hypothetical protein